MICETLRRRLVDEGSTVMRVNGGGLAAISEVKGTMMTIGYGNKWPD